MSPIFRKKKKDESGAPPAGSAGKRGKGQVKSTGPAAAPARQPGFVTSQSEFESDFAAGHRYFTIVGDVDLVVSTPEHIDLIVNAGQPRVVAWGSSQPRVEARGRYGPVDQAVMAYDYVQLAVEGQVRVVAGPNVSILIEGDQPKCEGGHQTIRAFASKAEQWCARYGVKVVDGVAELYKAVNAGYISPHGLSYAPGTTPIAKDWDGGRVECGGGLHFSPTVGHTKNFVSDAAHYLRCFVKLEEMRAPHENDTYPEKIKAKGCCAPCVEVDEDGFDVVAKASAA